VREGLQKIGELDQMAWGGVLILKSVRPGNQKQYEEDGKSVSGHPRQPSGSREMAISSSAVPRSSPTLPGPSRLTQLPDFITLPSQGTQVPVFDLVDLLSDHDLDELRQHHPRFDRDALFFRPGGNIPVDAMLAMWRLKGYSMHDREF